MLYIGVILYSVHTLGAKLFFSILEMTSSFYLVLRIICIHVNCAAIP